MINKIWSRAVYVLPGTAVLTAMLTVCADGQQVSTKIAVINMQTAILGTKDGQKASQQLMAKVDPKRKEFTTRQNEIAQLEQQLEKGETVIEQ